MRLAAVRPAAALLWATLATAPAGAQVTTDPLARGIRADADVIVVGVRDFAMVPDAGGAPARMMLLVDEPATRRMFVNDMRGPIYRVSYDGREVALWLDVDDARWGVAVQSSGGERGVQSFAFHPDFGRPGQPGYGKLYTWTDTRTTDVPAHFEPKSDGNAHHTVLLEWTAANPAAATYDGPAPRELMRFRQPYSNHNGGYLGFNPLAAPGDPDHGMLYVGVADGGSGGDPLDMAQDLGSAFGKVLRIDPLARDAEGGRYGIPEGNPWADDGDPGTLPEIWAYGLRNPQRMGWDPSTGDVYVSDIGQNLVEEISPVYAGANLGWNEWEGSFRFVSRSGVDASAPRSDPAMVYPVAEYAHGDPLLGGRAAATGVVVYRADAVAALTDRVLFGDFPSGEIFHFDADDPPEGGNQGFGRVLLDDGSGPHTFLDLVRAKNRAQGRSPANRTDLRFGVGPDNRVFLLNKADGTIRELTPRR